MLTVEIKARLAAQGLVPTGYVVMREKMPATPDKVICLEATGGAGLEQFLSGSESLDRPALQVRVRGAVGDADGPHDVAYQIYLAVDQWGAFTQSGVRYLSLQPLQAPYKMNEDANGRVEYTVNFLATKELA